MMSKPRSIFVFLCAIAFWFGCKPSTTEIAGEIEWDGQQAVTFRGKTYQSNWGGLESIAGYVRVKERHYKAHMPIVTYDIIITSGDFNDPEVVKIKSKGNGNFLWRSSKRNPEGRLVAYHTVPTGPEAQAALDCLVQGNTAIIDGWVSQNSEIKGNDGSFVKLLHDNHKFILVKDARAE